MRVLLDENVPLDLAHDLVGHHVDTVIGLGWAGLANGELLRRAQDLCDAFVTMDRNIEHQQNIPAPPLGVVLVRASSNRLVHLRLLVPEILGALTALRPGHIARIGT